MKRFFAAAAVVMGCAVLSSCSENAATPLPSAASASSGSSSSAPATSTPTQTQTAQTSAWEKYKQEILAAGFVNPNKNDGSTTDDEARQGAEAICEGPGGAKGLWELYDISLQMKPQEVDMPRIKRAASEFCASAHMGG